MSVYRTKGERISMKKFKIKTNLVSGVIMGVAALLLIIPVSYTHLHSRVQYFWLPVPPARMK